MLGNMSHFFTNRPHHHATGERGSPPVVTMEPSTSLLKRPSHDVSLMPPPPLKRIKRPAKVLDEDDYTSALSDIIARDYFPGLRETQAQQQYLAALESDDQIWVAEATQNLRQAMTPQNNNGSRESRHRNFEAPRVASGQESATARALDTPRGYDGSQTPATNEETVLEQQDQPKPELDTINLSLSSFQSKYTSEDNESFNTVLDKQNQKRREKHAYLWTGDQRISSARQIAHRDAQARLLKQKEEDVSNAETDGKALIPMTTGAVSSRPARPDAWTVKKPDNTFMFFPSSVDEDGLSTTQDQREAASRAGPKQVVHENTRFPPLLYLADDPPFAIPPSPSLNTDIILRRDAERANRLDSDSVTEYPGGDTPRVHGYAFVDEDEPSAAPIQASADTAPSYRDLLAGQVGESSPNPFKISSLRKREGLHHRLVNDTARKKREKDKETVKGLDRR